METQDIFILLKICAIHPGFWSAEDLPKELLMTPDQIQKSLKELRLQNFLDEELKPVIPSIKALLLEEIYRLYPVKPGKLARGFLTGAKPGNYFTGPLPYTSVWVWPEEDGKDWGYEITPLSPTCSFAVRQDRRLREILAITETIRVKGPEAKDWARESFKRIGLF